MFAKLKAMNKKRKAYDASLVRVAKMYNLPKWYFYIDVMMNKLLNGMGIVYYMAFGMYRLSQLERSHYVGGTKALKLERIFNTNKEKDALMHDKVRFNRVFGKYVHRDWIYGPDVSREQLEAFLNKHESFILKPTNTSQGYGVRKGTSEEALKDIGAFMQMIRNEELLMEEFIKQHEEMSAINPSSVNTIRIVTVMDRQGEVHVIGTSMRVGGADQVVDNFAAGGVQYPVDPTTGIVCGGGTLYDGTRNVFFHPSTNKQVIGFNIPNWNCVVETVKEAATLLEDIRYVGWDMAITETGCDMVEANINQGSNGMQQDGVGKYKIIMKYR